MVLPVKQEVFEMFDSELFRDEKREIDTLLEKGYQIVAVTENLSGAFVDFRITDNHKQTEEIKTLHIMTPNGRKYYSTKMLLRKKFSETI